MQLPYTICRPPTIPGASWHSALPAQALAGKRDVCFHKGNGG
jgi:hypothetical protein